MNLDVFRWIWRFCFVAFLATLFLNNLSVLQLSLLAAVIGLRVYIVKTDRTIY